MFLRLPPAKRSFFSDLKRVWIMGVMNITPDSFYEGSRFPTLNQAIDHVSTLIQDGVDVLDLGGESTRPGSLPVSTDEECRRVLPIVAHLRTQYPTLPLSIDTQKAEVARQALALGAEMINDVSALRHDPEMAAVVADAKASVVLMHRQGIPETMQKAPTYVDVVDEVKSFFEERLTAATRAGISEEQIVLDPGIGFGKTLEHNLALLKRLQDLVTLGRPILVGVSRKSFLGRLGHSSETVPVDQRLEGSLAAGLWSVAQGASALRVHDVSATRRSLDVWQAVSA